MPAVQELPATKEVEQTLPARKKIKTSDLPLSSASRSAVDSLAHTFKKKGGYDTIRKKVWEKFEGSVGLTTVSFSLISYSHFHRNMKLNLRSLCSRSPKLS